MLERGAVEEEGLSVASEEARGLVENPARHADREGLRTLAGAGELERFGSKLATAQSARATPTSSAAEEESPAPAGSVERIRPWRPTGGLPSRSSLAATACANRAQPWREPRLRPPRAPRRHRNDPSSG